MAEDRRDVLKLLTCGVGAGLGLAIVGPAARLVLAPAGEQTVTTPTEPLDLGAIDRVKVGGPWRRFEVVAPVVADAWTSARDVVLGSAFVRQPTEGQVVALSAICPHLGCAVGYDRDSDTFLCPCHNSKWNGKGALAGAAKAKRGLDPLPIEIKDGRLSLTWKLYKLDIPEREPV
ncbi:MAG TPA: Rieske 2Fe-2S domain-containing protein [Kofleriaceae bacterium]|jgi:Rieske Fe-S protein